MSGSMAVADALSMVEMPHIKQQGSHDVAYYKVVHLLPSTSMVVDATSTRIELKVMHSLTWIHVLWQSLAILSIFAIIILYEWILSM